MEDLPFLVFCGVTFVVSVFAAARGVYFSARKLSPRLVVALTCASVNADAEERVERAKVLGRALGTALRFTVSSVGSV